MKKELYQNLVALHERRLDVARAWLARPEGTKNLFVGDARTPHSPAWFAALDARNPKQAAMTRLVIQAAGSLSVCSICGDDPATDFAVEEDGVDPSHQLVLKLCDDCCAIRLASGERINSIH